MNCKGIVLIKELKLSFVKLLLWINRFQVNNQSSVNPTLSKHYKVVRYDIIELEYQDISVIKRGQITIYGE